MNISSVFTALKWMKLLWRLRKTTLLTRNIRCSFCFRSWTFLSDKAQGTQIGAEQTFLSILPVTKVTGGEIAPSDMWAKDAERGTLSIGGCTLPPPPPQREQLAKTQVVSEKMLRGRGPGLIV